MEKLKPGERLMALLGNWWVIRPDEDWSHLSCMYRKQLVLFEPGVVPPAAVGVPWHSKHPCQLGCSGL